MYLFLVKIIFGNNGSNYTISDKLPENMKELLPTSKEIAESLGKLFE